MNVTQAELDALLRRLWKPQGAVAMPPPAKPNKYGAKRTEYNGRTYDSKAEAGYAMRLDLRLKAREIMAWEAQSPVVVELDTHRRMQWRQGWQAEPEGYELVLKSRLDFLVTLANGAQEYHEVKGFRVRDWPLRERILRLAGVPLVVVR